MADKFLNLTALVPIKAWAEQEFTNKIEKIKVNGTEQTITDKAVDLLISEVAIGNDGRFSFVDNRKGAASHLEAMFQPSADKKTMGYFVDGASDFDSMTFATTDYVDENGGKIDKINVNGIEQTITNKAVDLKVPEVSYKGDYDTVGAEGRISSHSNDAIVFQKTTEGVLIAALIDDNQRYRGFRAINVYSKENADSTFRTEQQVQAAIDAALADITGIDFKVVDALPATGEHGVIYLLANAGATGNVYDEYIWITPEGGTAHYEKIGTTEVDLSDYWTSDSGHDNSLEAATVAEIQAILNA